MVKHVKIKCNLIGTYFYRLIDTTNCEYLRDDITLYLLYYTVIKYTRTYTLHYNYHFILINRSQDYYIVYIDMPITVTQL